MILSLSFSCHRNHFPWRMMMMNLFLYHNPQIQGHMELILLNNLQLQGHTHQKSGEGEWATNISICNMVTLYIHETNAYIFVLIYKCCKWAKKQSPQVS